MPLPKDIEPTQVDVSKALEQQGDGTWSNFNRDAEFTVPLEHFTFCFDILRYGLAPVEMCLGAPARNPASFGGYAGIAGQDRRYLSEHEVVEFLIGYGMEEDDAIALLVETNHRNMNRII
jgi:hypothetical protein